MSSLRANQNPPPLKLIAKTRVLPKKSVLPKPLLLARVAKPYKPTYKPLSAAVPFFTSGRLNSVHEIVSSSKEVGAQEVGEANSAHVTASAAVQVVQHEKSSCEMDQPERISGFPKSPYWNLDEAIVETADKTTQTHCQCECQCTGFSEVRKTASSQQLTREVIKLGHIIRGVASKITGEKSMDVDQFFPIKSLADLQTIQSHIEKTENFRLRLDIHLKHLIPVNSNNLTFALRQLVTDEFLYHKNWDGDKKSEALKVFGFFNSTLFEAWKSPQLPKAIFVKVMRAEIKKAHDRHYQYLIKIAGLLPESM